MLRREALSLISEFRGSIGDVIKTLEEKEPSLLSKSTAHDPTALTANLSASEAGKLYGAFHRLVEAQIMLGCIT